MGSRTSSYAADPGSLSALHQAMRQGRTSPLALLETALTRIDAVEGDVQGFRLIDRDGATRQAERLHTEAKAQRWRGPLHGIPVAIKDVIDVAGFPTRAGSRTRAGIAPSSLDAWTVTQLRDAGAIIVGKAHTTEFAYFDGPPPTRNPHNLAHTPGGSSSGPAAVVAAGMTPLSLGTQTAGSVSRPAAYCGIAAFKPSTLSWSAFGIVPFAPSFDTPGIFAYRTADAVAAARALMPDYLRRYRASPSPSGVLTIAGLADPLYAAASPAVTSSADAALATLSPAGAALQMRSPVPLADILAAHKTVSEYELARVHRALLDAPAGDVGSGFLEAIVRGAEITPDAYARAGQALAGARERFWSAAGHIDALLVPAAPDTAPAGMKTGDPRFVIPFTALGGPIVSVPVGFHAGLPLGVMLTSAPGTDMRLLALAERLAGAIELPR